MEPKPLSFMDLSKRHPGVSKGIAMNYSEAVRVCMDRHHTSPSEFSVTDNNKNARGIAESISADERLKNAWANKDDATRDGAYGLCLAALEVIRSLVAVSRAETRTGCQITIWGSRGLAWRILKRASG